jgi:DNA-binding response OmpR family regulator
MPDGLEVLLIEDDESVRHVVVEALADEGYLVREAADGRAALALLAAWQPDVILLDLMMPGLDGRAFRAEQRRLTAVADVPLVVLSASRHAPAAGVELGAAAVIAKPFDLTELIATIDRVTARARRDGAQQSPPTGAVSGAPA